MKRTVLASPAPGPHRQEELEARVNRLGAQLEEVVGVLLFPSTL